MGKGRPPKVDALVLCRAIATDREGKRWDLQGVVRHGRLEGETFPLTLPGLGVYFSLTGMQGTYSVAVEIVELASGKVLRGTEMTGAVQMSDPLAFLEECIQLPEVTFPNRGRHVCRLLVNGDLLHEKAFEVDIPRRTHAEGQMSPQSFARAVAGLRAKEPGLDDERLARICGVEPRILQKMATTFEGVDPVHAQQVVLRLCQHFRIRPEEFFEGTL